MRRDREAFVIGGYNAGRVGNAALAAVLLAALCTPAVWARGQRVNAPAYRSAPAQTPHASASQPQTGKSQPTRPLYPNRPGLQRQTRPQGSAAPRPAPGYPGTASRPAFRNPAYPASPYTTPARPTYNYPGAAPPGHLGDWLNQHRNLPPQEQERLLRSDPSFNRLPAQDQQRLVQRLHQVNQMPEEQRQRTLARAEMIEHLSPQERMQINLSARRWAAMPADRQALMKGAFRDLRAVPVDQRQMVLNSSRYQGVFSPDERGILSDMLRVEPYQPAR